MSNRQGKPYAGTRLAKYLEKRILELRPKKTQIAIASEAGFVNPNMLACQRRSKNRPMGGVKVGHFRCAEGSAGRA